MGKKKIPQSEDDSDIKNRKRKADTDIINNIQLQLNLAQQRLSKLEKANSDLEIRNVELEEQLDALTNMVEDNIFNDTEEDDDQADYNDEDYNDEDYNDGKILSKDELNILKSMIFSHELTIEKILKEKNLSSSNYKKEYDICKNYVDLIGRKIITQEDLEYFTYISVEEKLDIMSKEEKIQSLNSNSIPPRFKILKSNLSTDIKDIIIKKIATLNEMEPSSGEYNKLNQWVDGLMKIPWGNTTNLPVSINSSSTEINSFLSDARKCMNDVIYGQNNTKDHIVEIIGKMISNPSAVGNVFAIHGPMGTGKTTIIKEGMSKALGMPFNFISLGGTSDSSYLDGHSYTYEGSVPGRIVECLKTSKCLNPIFYFDELDKVSETARGNEIINMLIHLTDPSQNSNFQDKYYAGIPIDISKSIFVFSFNHLDAINPILKDRMHLIKVDGFNSDDKFHISKNFLIPSLLKDYNLTDTDIIFTDDIIKHIIMRNSGGEPGVRDVKRRFESIISKLNVVRLHLLESEIPPTKKRRITKDLDTTTNPKSNNKKKINNSSSKSKSKSKSKKNCENMNNLVFNGIELKNIKFPLTIDREIVNKLIPSKKSNFPSHLYI